MLVSAAVAQSSVGSDTIDNLKEIASNEAVVEEIKISNVTETSDPSKTKEIVAAYFADAPIMVDVAYCESRFRQYDESTGQPMRGWANPRDVGVLQINEDYHLETANKLGHNIYTLEGNLSYARYLYETQGTRPWVHSSPCWSSSAHVASR